jgi:hypothetical protein
MFEEGKSNKEIAETVGTTTTVVRVYRNQWKELQQLNINLLRSVGGGGDEAVEKAKIRYEA